MTLQELAVWEKRLIAALPAHGHFEDLIPQVEAARLPEQWQQVVEGYASLLDDPEQGLEALRRAIFLVWYSYNEPWPLTGIRDLSAEVERLVLQRLDQHLASGQSDAELCSMLRGYGPGLPFDLHPQLVALNRFLTGIQGPYSPNAPLGSLQARGAMGEYWLSRNDLPNKPLERSGMNRRGEDDSASAGRSAPSR
jgi:hypothetical protein